MNVSFKDLMDKLGVGYELGPYETMPWSVMDSEKGIACNAEVRRSGDGGEIEAEIQFIYDTPPPGKPPVDLACLLKCKPVAGDEWNVVQFTVRGEPYGTDIYNWEEKSCRFFHAVVQDLLANKIPDIDELLEEYMHSRERGADQYGGGGGKSPKIRPGALLDLKKGRGF